MKVCKPMRILVIIPAYNEAENIKTVVDQFINKYTQYDYIVINDGSVDETENICRKNGYNLVSLPINLGLSNAVMTGMHYAYKHNYDCAVQFDADGQHLPQYIESLKQCIEDGADIAIGSRFVSEKKPKTLRMAGSNLLSNTIKIITKQKITDPTSGMRMYNKKAINEYVQNVNFDPEPDTIAFLIRDGFKIKEVQVSMNERLSGESKFNVSSSMWYMLRMFISITFIHWFRRRFNSK